PLDVVDRDLADRAMQERLDIAPAPDEGRVPRLRLDRGDALVAVPQRMQVLRFQLRDEGACVVCSRCSVSHVRPPLPARPPSCPPPIKSGAGSRGHPVRTAFSRHDEPCHAPLAVFTESPACAVFGNVCHVLGSFRSIFAPSMMMCLMK